MLNHEHIVFFICKHIQTVHSLFNIQQYQFKIRPSILNNWTLTHLRKWEEKKNKMNGIPGIWHRNRFPVVSRNKMNYICLFFFRFLCPLSCQSCAHLKIWLPNCQRITTLCIQPWGIKTSTFRMYSTWLFAKIDINYDICSRFIIEMNTLAFQIHH